MSIQARIFVNEKAIEQAILKLIVTRSRFLEIDKMPYFIVIFMYKCTPYKKLKIKVIA